MSRVLRFSVLLVTAAALVPGQPPAGLFTGVGNFSHIAASLDKSLEFYRDLLGLELNGPVRPFDANPAIMKLVNIPGVQSRYVALRVPGSALGVEIIDYKDIDRQPAHPRFQDPGTANLILSVRNLESVLSRLKKAGAHMVTPDGKPAVMTANGSTLHVAFVQDPDGFLVELSQRDPLPQTTAPPSSNVIGGSFEAVVNDMDQTLRFYRDGLGFYVQQPPSAFSGDKLRMETAGTPGAQYRQARALIPGTSVPLAWIQFKDIDRKPLHSRVQDPGTAILQLRVKDTAAVAKAITAAGGTIISTDGKPVAFGKNASIVLARDPNNLFLELIAAPPAP